MSGKKNDVIRQLLAERFRESSRSTIYGTVLEVNEENRTCKVQIGDIEYEDVLLYAIENGGLKGWVQIPAKDSQVLVSRVDGSDRLYVSMYSVIDKIILTIGDKMTIETDADKAVVKQNTTLLRITAKGLTFKRDSSGLKKSLTDLLSALEKLTVTTNIGPSGIPINVADFTKIKQDLNNYLEE